MLPYIASQNKKKTGMTISEQITKQWAQNNKQLQTRVKLINSKISTPIINDFYKICKLKEIPQFYSSFLILSLEKQTQDKQAQIFSAQIREIINQRSCYHKIQQVLQRRPEIIKKVESQLEIAQGFQDMNNGKAIKASIRAKINETLKQATTLQQIKDIQKQSIANLASSIIQLRKNSMMIIQCVKEWRESLIKNVSMPSHKKNKVRIMFPYSGINCVLLPLFDQGSVLNSFLNKHFELSNENNPFIIFGKDLKRRNQFQDIFRRQISNDENNYEDYTNLVMAQLPVKQDPDQKLRQIQERNRQRQQQKINRLKQIREKSKAEKQQKQKQKKLKQDASLQKQKKQSLKKQSKSVIDIEGILFKHRQRKSKKDISQTEIQEQQQVKPNSMQNQRKQNKLKGQQDSIQSPNKKGKKINNVINIYGLKQKFSTSNTNQNPSDKIKQIMNQKAVLQQQLKQANIKNKEFEKLLQKIQKSTVANPNKKQQLVEKQYESKKSNPKPIQQEQKIKFQSKIEAVYKSRHQKKISNNKNRQLNNSGVSIEDLVNDKKQLERQLKQQTRQKNELQRLLKKSQGEIGKRIQQSNLQKSRLEEKIQNMQKRMFESPKNKYQGLLKKSRASILSVYTNEQVKNQPESNLFESKLLQEKEQRISLQKQIKQLIKQKTKLQKVVQKSQSSMVKQKQALQRKMQKYEQTIQKLKKEQGELKKRKVVNEDEMVVKRGESLRMYTTTPMKQKIKEQKNTSMRKVSQHVQSANYFKLPPQIKKSKLRQPTTIQEKDEEQNKKSKEIVITKSLNKVEIIQTKKTIEIIYEAAKRRKKQDKEKKQDNQKKDEADSIKDEELQKVRREKQNLIYQLQREKVKKQQEQKAKQRKAIKQQGQVQKYKQVIERERLKKMQLQDKIRNLKKQLFQQFELKLKNEKMKFNEQKRQLMAALENEKGERQLKQKYLHNQVKFLKEMQANQNQLIKLLETQKKNRLEKQKQLAAQIAKKQELLQIIEIEEIKKGIQTQIRQELQKNSDEDEEEQQVNIEQKKQQLRIEIQEMNNQKNAQLEEIDQQNQKLKALIDRIKNQQNKILTAIKENFNEESDNFDDQNQIRSILKTEQRQNLRPQDLQNMRSDNEKSFLSNNAQSRLKQKNISQLNSQQKSPKLNLEETEKIFKSRVQAQEDHENKMSLQLKNIRQSPQYKGKQQVQNLIEMYLNNPHEYPPADKKRNYSPQQKQIIKQDVIKRSKQAGDFERQLLKLRQVQQFVPTSEDDIMTSHLLSLKRVYQEKQSSALKQELFPSIKQDQQYHDHELSFQSEQAPPPKTIRDHVQIHAKQFPIKKSNSKNFLSINRMRVAMLQENRKEKQKQLIEDQAKRRAQAEILKKNMRAKEQQRLRIAEQKKKKFEQEQQKLKSAELPKKQKKKQRSKKIEQKKQPINSQSQQSRSLSKDKLKETSPINKQKNQPKQNSKQQIQQSQEQFKNAISQRQISEENSQASMKQKQKSQKEQEENQIKDFDTRYLQVTNQHSSLDRERKQLEEDVYQYQQQIRSFVSRDEKYDIYQQFVQESEINGYLHNLVSISSDQVKGLNNNNTLFKDIPTYKSVIILIAKDKSKGVQVGIAVLHKEPQDGLYICDYILTHNMRNFLNFLFNISRFIFKIDIYTNKIQYFFDLNKLQDEISIINFIQFQEKCKRMGQVYVKVGADKTRKYVLRRNLFEPLDKQFEPESNGILFQTSIEIHSDLIRQRGVGFKNNKHIQYFSSTALVAYYMKKQQQILNVFRKNAEDDLKYRQLLLTTLMFQKKQIQLKNCSLRALGIEQKLQISKKLHNQFTIQDPTHGVQQLKFLIEHSLSQKTKRCTFQIDEQQINYIIHSTEEAVTKIQSSNSSQTGIFMNLIPKYKMLIIEAHEFITMNKVNPEINVFFYIKHFIKNISDVGKEEHPKIFIPEVSISNEVFLKDLSDRAKVAIFAKEKVKFGWSNQFSNSIVFTPSHKDLVIKKPFIISLLSATVERVIQGTPLFATLIQ